MSCSVRRLTSLAAAFAVATPAAALAQASGAEEVTEIVVTAQKRTQNLQDVPIVVTTVNAQLLRDTGVRDIKDLTILAPGLIVTSTTSEASTTARIRGVGTVGDNPGLESSVGVVVDGVYRARNSVGFGDLGEVERIEVLKGPQSTIFGKSTSAGVINVLTTAPTFKFGAEGEATAGNYSNWGASAAVNGPIADNVAGRLYVARRKRDGYLDVITGAGPRSTKEDVDQDLWTLRGQLLFRSPDEKVQFRVIADYSHRAENCCSAVQILVGDSPVSRARLVDAVRPGSVSLAPDPYARVGYANRDTTSKLEEKGVSLQGDIDFGGAKLTSVSAFRSWQSLRGQDSDFSAADIYYRPADHYVDQFDSLSQELRLAGEHGKLNWLVGLFYAHEQYRGESPYAYGNDYYAFWAGRVLSGAPALIGAVQSNTFTPGAGASDYYTQNDDTFALFTNNTLAITSAWDLTVGLRYTIDKKDLKSTFHTTGGSCDRARQAYGTLVGAVGQPTAERLVAGMCLPWETEALDAASGVQKRTEKEWSGTAKTSYRFTPGVMGYASYARGYKAGGFNFERPSTTLVFTPAVATLLIAGSTGFAPETVNSFEAGLKTQWFNNTVTVNATAFHQTFKNFQLNTFLGTNFVVETIPSVRSRGVDLDFRWRTPIDYLLIQGGVTYAQTEYGTFGANDLQVPSRFAAFARLPGGRLSFAPLWSGSVSGTYERPIAAGLTFRANVSAKYNSGYNTGSDLSPQKYQPAFTLVNARIGIGSENGRWQLEGWVQNLTKVDYLQVAFNSPLQGLETDPAPIRTYAAFLGAPRTYGMTLRVKY